MAHWRKPHQPMSQFNSVAILSIGGAMLVGATTTRASIPRANPTATRRIRLAGLEGPVQTGDDLAHHRGANSSDRMPKVTRNKARWLPRLAVGA
jgi:hypothetical protein